MSVSYLSHFDYLDAPAGLETASLLGNSLRLSSAVVAGATALPVTPNTTINLSQFDKITLYDGPNSEVVQVASTTSSGASSIPLLAPGLAFNHAQYTPCSSKGILGDIGAEILKASGWVENITRQSLFSQSYTETLRMPTMRASIDNQNVLVFRPGHYPVTALSAISMGTNTSTFVSYDPAQAIIDANELVTVPQLLATGSGSSTYSLIAQQVSRQQNAYLTITYTAGFAQNALPGDIRDAAILLTSDLLSRRQNPTGADDIGLGDKHLTATLRGDKSGDSLLVKHASFILSNYTVRAF